MMLLQQSLSLCHSCDTRHCSHFTCGSFSLSFDLSPIPCASFVHSTRKTTNSFVIALHCTFDSSCRPPLTATMSSASSIHLMQAACPNSNTINVSVSRHCQLALCHNLDLLQGPEPSWFSIGFSSTLRAHHVPANTIDIHHRFSHHCWWLLNI